MDATKWIAVAGTMLGAFMAILDIQITNSSLQDISGGISATADEGSWISTSYLIGEIITIPLTAWFSKIFSIRYYLLVNIVLFLTFSALCGISTNLGEMIVFRAGQGFTGGVFIPTALTVIITYMPKNLQGVGQAMFGLTATLAPAVGPYIGGLLTDRLGWEWNFYINFVPRRPDVRHGLRHDPEGKDADRELRNGDWWGIACISIGLGALVAMLEEGQRKDWFGNDFIRTCGILAAIFVPAFILIEIFGKHPVVNLRLLLSRNLGLSTVVAFVLGMGLYGSVYLIPLYLGEVQGYSPLLIGETLIWVGTAAVAHLSGAAFVDEEVRHPPPRFHRLSAFRGELFHERVHGVADYAKDQFIWANVVRALGQPFTIVPITGLAVATLARKDAGDGSAIFNMFRNLGGSVGIAILSTVVTRREQFHDERIGESVTAFSLAAQGRLQSIQAQFVARGFDPTTAMNQAYGVVKRTVRREANIMAFNDAFLIVGISLLLGAIIVWFCKKPQPGAAAAAH